jgi:hypothetical protein
MEVGTKFDPLSVIVVSPLAPATTLAGLAASTLGMGLFTISGVEADVPPPGAGLTAAIASVWPTARSDMVSVAMIWVALWKAVARGIPFTCTAVVGTKLVPVSVTVADGASATTLTGVTCASVGVGLFIVKLTTPDELLPPLLAVTDRIPPLASCAAGTAAITWVLLTNVVASAVLPTWMTVADVNPVPVTVTAVAELPAVKDEGLIDVTVKGDGCCWPPPSPLELPHPRTPVERQTHKATQSTALSFFMSVLSLGPQCARGKKNLSKRQVSSALEARMLDFGHLGRPFVLCLRWPAFVGTGK